MDWKGIKSMLKTVAHVAIAGLRAMLVAAIPFACVVGLVLQSLKAFGGVILVAVLDRHGIRRETRLVVEPRAGDYKTRKISLSNIKTSSSTAAR